MRPHTACRTHADQRRNHARDDDLSGGSLRPRARGRLLRRAAADEGAAEARTGGFGQRVRRGLEHHLDETKNHVANLEQVFQEIGVSAKGEKCPGIDGIKEEHDTFLEENDPSDELLDLFVTGAAARTEHYEIAAYTGLVEMAGTLGESKAAELLETNLRQEKEALKKVESISKRLLKDSVKAGSR